MGKQTWNPQQPETNNLTFSELLLYPFEDYESIIHMWNEKYCSYIKMANEVPHAIFIKTEEFSSRQEDVYKQLGHYLPAKDSFQPLNTYLNGSVAPKNRDHTQQGKEYPSFNKNDLAIVNAF